MKANELRIGNWVLNILKNPCLVLGISYYGKIQTEKLDEDIDTLSPIPLTEEWLLKFGFEDMEDEDVKVFCKTFGKFDGEDYEDAICITKDNKGSWYFSLNRKVIINTVHQLQNLYFALTGEELTIKENVE